MRRRLYIATWVVNVAATVAYGAWIAHGESERVLFARDGILAVLPVLPLAFVFLYLLREGRKNG